MLKRGIIETQQTHYIIKNEIIGKKYFLGINDEGLRIYLKKPSWDCSWYWGFGHLAFQGCYTHYDSYFKPEHNETYYHHINESPKMKKTVLTDSESWQLADLMQSFYTLRKTAKIARQGNSHLTSVNNCDLKNSNLECYINLVLIPRIFKAIDDMFLNPQWIIKHDGELKAILNDEKQLLPTFHKLTHCSMDWACKFEGWTVEKVTH